MSDVPWAKRTRRTLRIWAIRAGALAGRGACRSGWPGRSAGSSDGSPGGGRRAGSSRGRRGASPWRRSPRLPGDVRGGAAAIARRCLPATYGHGARRGGPIARTRPRPRAVRRPSPATAMARLRAACHAAARGSSSSPATWAAGSCSPGASSAPASGHRHRSAQAGDRRQINELAARFRAEGGTTTLLREDPAHRPRPHPQLPRRQGARHPHRPGHQGAERLRPVLRAPGLHSAGGGRPRAALRLPGDRGHAPGGEGTGQATATSSRWWKCPTTRLRPTGRPRPSGSSPPAAGPRGAPSAGAPPSGSGCTGAGRPSRRNPRSLARLMPKSLVVSGCLRVSVVKQGLCHLIGPAKECYG